MSRQGPLLGDLPGDVTVHDLGAGRLRRALGPLLRLIWRLRPDVVVSELSHVNVALVLLHPILPRRTRLVLHEHTTLSAELAERRRGRHWGLAYRWL